MPQYMHDIVALAAMAEQGLLSEEEFRSRLLEIILKYGLLNAL